MYSVSVANSIPPPSSFIRLRAGVIRIGLPSMQVKKLKSSANKIGSKSCIWSNSNAPGTQSNQVGRIPLSHFQPSPLWGNKNWPPSMKVEKVENFHNKKGLKRYRVLVLEWTLFWFWMACRVTCLTFLRIRK